MADAEKRKEGNRLRDRLKKELTQCANCGSTENLEYHHIVPLALGGSNNVSNMVCLCTKCHQAVTTFKHRSECIDFKNAGKPPLQINNKYIEALINGEIGNKAFMGFIGAKSKQPSSVKEYRKYIEIQGIEKVNNTLDLTITLSDLSKLSDMSDLIVSRIYYKDGRIEERRFCDTGMNDDTVYKRRGCDSQMTFGQLKEEARKLAEERRIAIERKKSSTSSDAQKYKLVAVPHITDEKSWIEWKAVKYENIKDARNGKKGLRGDVNGVDRWHKAYSNNKKKN